MQRYIMLNLSNKMKNSICLKKYFSFPKFSNRRTMLHKINVSFGYIQLFKQKCSPRICVINPGG